jgi:hypothetical protein
VVHVGKQGDGIGQQTLLRQEAVALAIGRVLIEGEGGGEFLGWS